MLVLSRRVGEKIVIGDDIVVTVVEVHRDSVRLGVDAPRSVPVNRAELLEAVTAENVRSLSDTESVAALDAFKEINPAGEGRKVDIKALMRGAKGKGGARGSGSAPIFSSGNRPSVVPKPSEIKAPHPKSE